MNVTSVAFVAMVIVALALYEATTSRIWQNRILFVCNAIFLSSFAQSPFDLLPILAFAGFGYGAILAMHTRPNLPLWIGVITVLLLFVYLKHYKIVPSAWQIDGPYITVGLSYVLFRILHLMIDMQGGDIMRPLQFIDYFVYLFFFPSFLSGPIQRYQDFQTQREIQTRPTNDEAKNAMARMANGYIKTLISAPLVLLAFTYFHQASSSPGSCAYIEHLSPILQQSFLNVDHQCIAVPAALYCLTMALYAFYLYFNFSGYMDIVLSIGRLFGIKMPENFNHPFYAGNLMDFWARWHITLSQWFKFYVFNPLFKAVSTHIYTSSSLAGFLAVPVFFVSFFLMGIWHGSTTIFLFYGLFWGLGVSINQLYQILMRRQLGRKSYTMLTNTKVYMNLTRAGTFCFFGLALTCFWMPEDEFKYIAHFLGIKGVIWSSILLVCLAFVMLPLIDKIINLMEAFIKVMRDSMVKIIWENNVLTATKFLLAIYYFVGSGSNAPEFVYRAF